MRRTTVLWGAAACVVLAACTGQGPADPASPPTADAPSSTVDRATDPSGTPGPTGDGATTPGATGDGPSATPSATPAAVTLFWADGTPVEGAQLDLGAASRVRLGTDVTHVRDVPAEPGRFSLLDDLRPDGSFLTLAADAGGTGGGTAIGALREVTATGERTLRPPPDTDLDRLTSIASMRRVDGGIAWIEVLDGGAPRRLVLAPDGSSQGRAVRKAASDGDAPAALARWGAVLLDGRVLAWDGTVTGEPAEPALELRHVEAGDDVVETRCDLEACEIVLITEGGRREPLLRGPLGTWVLVADGRYVVAVVDREDGTSTTWGVDTRERTAVRIVGELWGSAMSEGRILAFDDPDARVVVVDLAAGTAEQLRVETGAYVDEIAGDLIAVTTGYSEGAGADGDGGDVLRWPHGAARRAADPAR